MSRRLSLCAKGIFGLFCARISRLWVPMRHVIAIFLQNEAGALGRVTNLFATRGYNIESLAVAPTPDPTVSRLTLVTTGDDDVIGQVISQLGKLLDVIEVIDLSQEADTELEMLLISLTVAPEALSALQTRIIKDGGRVLSTSETGLVATLTAHPNVIDVCIDRWLANANLLDLARSGVLALTNHAAKR
jgi:acetolactate synthase I/III small subunit